MLLNTQVDKLRPGIPKPDGEPGNERRINDGLQPDVLGLGELLHDLRDLSEVLRVELHNRRHHGDLGAGDPIVAVLELSDDVLDDVDAVHVDENGDEVGGVALEAGGIGDLASDLLLFLVGNDGVNEEGKDLGVGEDATELLDISHGGVESVVPAGDVGERVGVARCRGVGHDGSAAAAAAAAAESELQGRRAEGGGEFEGGGGGGDGRWRSEMG